MQIKNQKVLEETPSTCLSPKLRDEIGEVAVKVAKTIDYVNAGTVEFLIDKYNNYYFVEMNTRIQVEHPITEEVTGIDIVKEQINIACGKRLSFSQDDINIKGHCMECRINAENPDYNFRSSPGRVEKFIMPGGLGVRIDTNVYSNYTIPCYYDSMIAKLITYGEDRKQAIRKMKRVLDEVLIEGVDTNIEFQKWLISQEEFLNGSYNTEFLSKKLVNINEFNK